MGRVAFLTLFAFLYSCADTNEVIELNPTELEVRVLDGQGAVVPNAEVRIFRNERDWNALTREVDIQNTDQNGVAYFTNLLPLNYYFFASFEKNSQLITNQTIDEFGNLWGTNYELADFLTDNAITRVTVNATSARLQIGQIDSVTIFSSFSLIFLEKYEFGVQLEDSLEIGAALIENFDYSSDLASQIINAKADFIGPFSDEIFSPTYAQEFMFDSFSNAVLGINELPNYALVFYTYDYATDQFEFIDEQYLPAISEFTDSGNTILPYQINLTGIPIGDGSFLIDLSLNYL